MNEQREKISSLMDDFRPTEKDQSVLKEVMDDVNQQYTMRRYQLIGELMRNETPQHIKLDFAAEVMSQIEHELVYQQKESIKVKPAPVKPEKESSWLWSVFFKPVTGLAVAATVAFVAVSSLQLQTAGVETPEQIAAVTSSQVKVEQLASIPVINRGISKVSVSGQNMTTSVGMNWKIKRNEPAIQKKLNTYLINHNEHSNSMQGIIPQVRVVGFDAQK